MPLGIVAEMDQLWLYQVKGSWGRIPSYVGINIPRDLSNIQLCAFQTQTHIFYIIADYVIFHSTESFDIQVAQLNIAPQSCQVAQELSVLDDSFVFVKRQSSFLFLNITIIRWKS